MESKLEFTPTYERLPTYLNLGEQALRQNQAFISGTEIANALDRSSIQVRKDLAFAGLKGIPKRGYEIKQFVSGLRKFLGWDKDKKAFLIGVGNLGKAIILHDEFADCGLRITDIFDSDKKKIGKKVGALKITDIAKLENRLSTVKPDIAILTLSYSADVQTLCTTLAEHGIKGIWNFTNQKLVLKENVAVYNADFTAGLAVLYAHINKQT